MHHSYNYNYKKTLLEYYFAWLYFRRKCSYLYLYFLSYFFILSYEDLVIIYNIIVHDTFKDFF